MTDRDEGVAAAQEQLTLQSQLEKIGAEVEAIEVSIRSSEDELNTLDLQRSHLSSELARLKSELTRQTAKKVSIAGLEIARLQDIDQALSELSDTDRT